MPSLMSSKHVSASRRAIGTLYKTGLPAVFYYGEADNGSILHITIPGKPAKAAGTTGKTVEKMALRFKDKPLTGKISVLAGNVQKVGELLVFETLVYKGSLTAASTRASIRSANTLNKLGIRKFTVGEIGGTVEAPEEEDPKSLPTEAELGGDEEEEGVEEGDDEERDIEEEGPKETPTPDETGQPESPASSPPDLQPLRDSMKSRAAAFQKGDVGEYVYFEKAEDGAPLLALSKPGSPLESSLRRVGEMPVEGAWRCVIPGGLELFPSGFSTAAIGSTMGIRFRAATSPITPIVPVAPPPPVDGPTAQDIQKLRTMIKTRAAAFQPGEVGSYVYFEKSNDGEPLLVFSKPGAEVESKMQRAGPNVTVKGAWRCMVPGGLELDPSDFLTKALGDAVGLRFRPARQPIVVETPEDAARLRRIRELENEAASWRTGIELLQRDLDEILKEETMDEATLRRADEMFTLIELRLNEAIAALKLALAEVEG